MTIELESSIDTNELDVYLNPHYKDYIELDDIQVIQLFQENIQVQETKKRSLTELDPNCLHLPKKGKFEKYLDTENIETKLTISPSLDKTIWQKLHYKTNRTRILKTKLDPNEYDEFTRLNKLMEGYIKDLGWCTYNLRFAHVEGGYLLRNKCKLKDCKSYWGMIVDINTNEAFIYNDYKCNHTI